MLLYEQYGGRSGLIMQNMPCSCQLMKNMTNRWCEYQKRSKCARRRFSIAGHGTVARVIATGIVNAGLILGTWPVPDASPYQSLLYAKVVIVAGMTAIAVFNRYGLVPRLRGAPQATTAMLRRATLMEVLLGLAAIACVSVFGLLDPG